MPQLIKREVLFAAAVLILMAAVFVLFYKIMEPFFIPIAWSVILVVTIHPLNKWAVAKYRRPNLVALILTILVFIVIIAPLSYLGIALVSEATNLYERAQESLSGETLSWVDLRNHPIVQDILTRLDAVVDTSQWDLKSAVSEALQSVSGFLVSNTAKFLTNVGVAIFHFALIILTIFYLFRDGDGLMGTVRDSIPLPPERADQILARLTDVVRATIYGGLVVAAVQGTLGGLMFWILGIPSPVFWGTVMGFFSLLPFIGAFVVYIPAAIMLALAGQYVEAIVMITFGTVVVSQIDNLLRPMLISGRTHIHPLLMFFSILGGIQVFGFLGLVLGPVVAAIFVGVFDVYRHFLREPVEEDVAMEDLTTG